MMEDNGTIKLDENSIWLKFEVGGASFEVEAFEAVNLLAEIDREHADDPNSCLKCKSKFNVEADGVLDNIVCPSCGARGNDVQPAQDFLDDVAKLIVERWGAKRCSRNEAGQFYNVIVAKTEEAKKNIGTPVE
jgi:dihydroorotate dehydrogenase